MRIFIGKHPRMWVQPTHESFWKFFLKSDSQGIRTKFLCHKIQHHLLNQKPYFSKKISTGGKVSSSEFTLTIPFIYPLWYMAYIIGSMNDLMTFWAFWPLILMDSFFCCTLFNIVWIKDSQIIANHLIPPLISKNFFDSHKIILESIFMVFVSWIQTRSIIMSNYSWSS